MRLPNELKLKVEEKRDEIRNESVKLRDDAKARHLCVNCGKSLENGKKVYCSEDCYSEFYYAHDFSVNSEILKEYKEECLAEYREENPVEEREPWTTQKANKDYKCVICGLTINKSEKYSKFTVLPGNDSFDDFPYSVSRFHLNCSDFPSYLMDEGLLSDEGYEDEEIEFILWAMAFELEKSLKDVKRMVMEGKFKEYGYLSKLLEDYFVGGCAEFETSCPSNKEVFVYKVRVKKSWIKDPYNELYMYSEKLEDPESYYKDKFSKFSELYPEYGQELISVRGMSSEL